MNACSVGPLKLVARGLGRIDLVKLHQLQSPYQKPQPPYVRSQTVEDEDIVEFSDRSDI